MSTLHFVGPWDLNRRIGVIPDDPNAGPILFVESREKSKALPFHKQKLLLVLSAMHHFAQELRDEGYTVLIENAPTYLEGIKRSMENMKCEKCVLIEPREWSIWRKFDQAAKGELRGKLKLLPDGGLESGNFLISREEAAEWFKGRSSFRLHHFYQQMRKSTGYLMQDGKPLGGKWSYDSDNRKHAKGITPPDVPAPPLTNITKEQKSRISSWDGYFGTLEHFRWPVTRQQALSELESFIESRAQSFGPYQDAMLKEHHFMWHTLVSSSLNLGLLHPREVCDRIISAFEQDLMTLESAEGLIRQVIGWREFVRAVYWHRMPSLRTANHLGATVSLPDFYWDSRKTDMMCLKQSVSNVETNGYAHHIQRLMVLGNYAMLCGINPQEVSHWFWAAFVDAFEWVELPNVASMALFSDTTFATKPYAASGNYINKMSDYCKSCIFNVKKRVGSDACPFNYLYWNFLQTHRNKFETHPRMARNYNTWDKKSDDEKLEIVKLATKHIESIVSESSWSFDIDAG